jgi:hypothetical protein
VEVKFKKISYLIDQSGGFFDHTPKRVTGYAFETPGWPEFHACVRYDRRNTWSAKAWILDHFESGLALSGVGTIKNRDAAPEALAAFLSLKGEFKVRAAIANLGVIPQAVERAAQ